MHDPDFPEYTWSIPEWMKGKVFVCNPHIAEYAEVSRDELQERLRNVRALRRSDSPRFLSYYIADESDWPAWEALYDLIQGKGMRYAHGNYDTCFGAFVPPSIHKWLLNTPLQTIRRQITLYLATLYASDLERQFVIREQIHPLFLQDLVRLASNYYRDFDPESDDIWEKPYLAASHDFLGSEPPPILFRGATFNMSREQQREWGVDLVDEFYIDIGFAYMTATDWNDIVLRDKNYLARQEFREKLRGGRGYRDLSSTDKKIIDDIAELPSEDNLYRSESDPLTWQQWLQACRNYYREKSPIYEPIEKNTEKGFVYLVRDAAGMTKIGFSKNVAQRLAALNTGSADQIELLFYFPVTGVKAERALHRIFEAKKRKLEWFHLSDEDIANISDKNWRADNGVF